MSHVLLSSTVLNLEGYMSRGFLKSSNVLPLSIDPIIKLWIYRVLVPLGGHKDFIMEHGVSDEGISGAIEFTDIEKNLEASSSKRAARKELFSRYDNFEKEHISIEPPKVLASNVKKIAQMVDLSDSECRILEFVVILKNEQILENTTDLLGDLSSSKVCYSLSVLLDLPIEDVKFAITPNSALFKSGLVTIDRNGSSDMARKLDVIDSGLIDSIYADEIEPPDLLRFMLRKIPSASLTVNDYGHLSEELEVLIPYIENVTDKGKKGVNIFLYGEPGTGKTELVKVLAEHLNLKAYEVASENDQGEPIDGERRLRAYSASQNFLSSTSTIIAFDEVEDVFDDGSSWLGVKSTAQKRKAWVNRILEENCVPTFWISNSVYCLDPAFVRRFDMVVKVKMPGVKQREKIINEVCGDLISQSSICKIAKSERLAPAVISKCADVVRLLSNGTNSKSKDEVFTKLINSTLVAQNHKPIKLSIKGNHDDLYNTDFINTQLDVNELKNGLGKTKSGRICIYGPPGTGKTEYGRWVARELGSDIILKKGSDLISMWVGGTEENIAKAFEKASENDSILMIDEVDGFLQNRRSAQNSWEVTGVNELLTQMESFEGIFITSTNLIDNLDQAALRRFDMKLLFDYMKPQQIERLVIKYCEYLNIVLPTSKSMMSIMSVNNVTPGDFAAVVRKSRLYPVNNGDDYVKQIIEDVSVKESIKRSIGFVH